MSSRPVLILLLVVASLAVDRALVARLGPQTPALAGVVAAQMAVLGLMAVLGPSMLGLRAALAAALWLAAGATVGRVDALQSMGLAMLTGALAGAVMRVADLRITADQNSSSRPRWQCGLFDLLALLTLAAVAAGVCRTQSVDRAALEQWTVNALLATAVALVALTILAQRPREVAIVLGLALTFGVASAGFAANQRPSWPQIAAQALMTLAAMWVLCVAGLRLRREGYAWPTNQPISFQPSSNDRPLAPAVGSS